tara:strand:- start:270 stop:848 length:579 start_codon:yes stop_codon:yes gene_type:complete
MVTIIPTPYIGQGLLGDDERNNILGSFAGGLLQGFTVNPTPVMGQYFTPIGGGTPTVTGGMQDQATMLTPEEFARMMQDYRNQQNLLNEGGFADDIGPEEAEPPSMEVSSLGEALSNMYSGFTDNKGQKQAGFKDLIAMSPYGKMASTIQGLLGMNAPVGARSFQEGFEYSADDFSQDERDAAFDADMQDEE